MRAAVVLVVVVAAAPAAAEWTTPRDASAPTWTPDGDGLRRLETRLDDQSGAVHDLVAVAGGSERGPVRASCLRDGALVSVAGVDLPFASSSVGGSCPVKWCSAAPSSDVYALLRRAVVVVTASTSFTGGVSKVM